MSIYNYPQVVPHLVEDINLKRARVETEEGDAIRVTGINCGDKVTIVPTLSEGTKIADFTINNVDGELYAPEAPTPPVTEVSITPSVVTGTKIADFSINNVVGELYAPQGGVGKTYPGSNGGEIFNYYGTDYFANTAGGNCCTTIGFNNKNNGSQNLMGGNGNGITGSPEDNSNNIIFGVGNLINFEDDHGAFLASGLLGSENQVSLTLKETAFNSSFLIGRGLSFNPENSGEQLNGCVILGRFNNEFTLSDPCFCVGCGYSSSTRINAIEVNPSVTKISNNLQLAGNSTQVNAITPALSNPASADDKTLVTKSHLGATLPMTHLVGAITGIDENSFPLDFTSYWTAARANDANMRISLRINGSCYSKSIYNCLAVDSSFECYRSSYDSNTQITTFSRYRFSWNYTNKTLTLTGSMSWEMSDAGAISNVTHGLTGLVITIYQIETY